MQLHEREKQLSDGQTIVYLYDDSGTLQGYLQGQGSSWQVCLGRKGDIIDTVPSREEGLAVLYDILKE